MIIHDIQQGSLEWHKWRKGKLSASKAPIILGLSPYQTSYQLWEEELGLRDPQPNSQHMQDGLNIEDAARDYFFQLTGICVNPACVTSSRNPLFIASLDGMNAVRDIILEIKKNNKSYHEMARSGNIFESHYAQVQHHMYVMDLKECHYLSYRMGDEVLVKVARNNAFIDDMVVKQLDFYEMLQNLTPPPLTDRDYIDMSNDEELHNLVTYYNTDVRALKFLEERIDKKRTMIKERIGDKNAKGIGWKMTKYGVKGRVDYDAILSRYNIDADLSQFRKPASFSYRLTIEGDKNG